MAAMTLFHAANSCHAAGECTQRLPKRLRSIDRQFLIYTVFGPVG